MNKLAVLRQPIWGCFTSVTHHLFFILLTYMVPICGSLHDSNHSEYTKSCTSAHASTFCNYFILLFPGTFFWAKGCMDKYQLTVSTVRFKAFQFIFLFVGLFVPSFTLAEKLWHFPTSAMHVFISCANRSGISCTKPGTSASWKAAGLCQSLSWQSLQLFWSSFGMTNTSQWSCPLHTVKRGGLWKVIPTGSGFVYISCLFFFFICSFPLV